MYFILVFLGGLVIQYKLYTEASEENKIDSKDIENAQEYVLQK